MQPWAHRLPARLRVFAVPLFASQLVALDLAMRGLHPYAHPRAFGSAAQSVALVWLLASLRGTRLGRAAIAVLLALVVACEAVFFRYYHVPIDAQVVASAAHAWRDVYPVALRALPGTLGLAAALSCVEYAWLCTGGTAGRARWPVRRLVAVSLAVSLLAFPLRDGTPELRLVDALTRHAAAAEASAATSVRLPILLSTREELPSVIVVLTESVRAEDDCSAPVPECTISPELNALFPDRLPLRQMRAVASYTAVSISALLTGREQVGPRAEIAAAPTLFDYARAVRARGQRLTVAYWSAQSSSMFERNDIPSVVDSFVTLETLLGQTVDDEDDFVDRGVDRLLADYTVRAAPSLTGPFLLVLHFAATHAPYFVDPGDAPFTPWRQTVTWSGLNELHNAQRDAIVAQDASIARSLRAVLASHPAAPYVVLFTSDHGEAFGEHGAIHHGQSLYDEQIHVPAWIASGRGGLGPDQARAVAAHENAFVTHLDLLPTVLDAWGVWNGFALASLESALPGRSLLAPPVPMQSAVPVTNCTGMFPCPLHTWGLLREDRELVAQPWDSDWDCVDLATGREHLAGDPACARLREASRTVFPVLPDGEPNL